MLFVYHPKILHKHCFQFLSGPFPTPKSNWRQYLCKILGWQTKSIMVCYGILWTKTCSVSQERGKIFTLFCYFIHSCPSFHWLVPGVEIVECGAKAAQSPPTPSLFFLLTSLWGPHDLNAYNCIIVACATGAWKLVGARKNWRARERHACLPLVRPFFLAPTTWNVKAPETGLTALSLCQ